MFRIICLILLLITETHAKDWVFNNPYPVNERERHIYYSSFTEQPKTLDLARAYSSNELLIMQQIYEPLLQYDYFTRPFKLIPLTAAAMPSVRYYDATGHEIIKPNGNAHHTIYTIRLKPGIYFQPHPAFARTKNGGFCYTPLTPQLITKHHQLEDFTYRSTRELVVDDYIYQIKRLANPALGSPIYGLMSQHILGFREFGATLPRQRSGFIDLRQYPLAGIQKIDDYTLAITLRGEFAQFPFWLTMTFFAPMPWEVEQFYGTWQKVIKNFNLNWYPVGTGPFMLTKNNPNRQMILERNPNYHPDYMPASASAHDVAKGYLHHAGARLPFIDQAIFTLEKESIPRWNKFLQGYYDLSGISADSFDKAIQVSAHGDAKLSKSLMHKGMRLERTPELTVYYLGFNMLDPLVGGLTERARKLRQAISIAIDYDEYITIFFNRRGQVAHGPLPPGIFGHESGEAGMNPVVFSWKNNAVHRHSIAVAKRLLREAGYPNGQNPKTGLPLIIHYDLATNGGPDDKAEMDWMRKQFAKLGIELDVRATQYNRFQEKIRTGNMQLYKWAWLGDYPDPENFFFILYGPNGKVKSGGENASNYSNPEFDRLFEQMRNRPNDEERLRLIKQMLNVVRNDAPWIFGMHSELFTISQSWVAPIKPSPISTATYKYIAIDVPLRNQLRDAWNKPIIWPLIVLFIVFFVSIIPYMIAYYKQQRASARRESKAK